MINCKQQIQPRWEMSVVWQRKTDDHQLLGRTAIGPMVKFSSRTWKENFNCCINKSLLRFFPPRFLWRTHCAVTFLWKDNFWENICYISLSCSPSKRGALGAVVEVISILISMRALLLSRHNGCCIHLLPTPRSTKNTIFFQSSCKSKQVF